MRVCGGGGGTHELSHTHNTTHTTTPAHTHEFDKHSWLARQHQPMVLIVDAEVGVWGPRWSATPCIVATGAEGLPVTDLASSFVLWADSGFKREPETLAEQIALVKGPQSYEEFLEDKKRRDRERRISLENLRRRSLTEATRRHHEEEQRRLLQDELDRISVMGWRELMEMERGLANSPWGMSQSIRAASQAFLYPEEGEI